MNKFLFLPDLYESPKIIIETVVNEGVLCASTTSNHRGFNESDDWQELLGEE